MTAPSVTGFGFNSASSVPRQIWIDNSGNVGYYFRNTTSGGNLAIELVKVSLTTTTIIATGTPFLIGPIRVGSPPGTLTPFIGEGFAPVGGYPVGGKVWVAGISGTDFNAVPTIYSFDTTTLNHVDTVVVSSTVSTLSASVQAMSADGKYFACYGFDTLGNVGIYVFDTTALVGNLYLFNDIGGPNNNINFIYDNATNIWMYGDDGQFWVFAASGGAVLPGAPIPTTGPTNPGQVDYNPVTDTITAWVQGSGTDYSVIPINATTQVIGSIGTLTSNWLNSFPDYAAPQTRIWGTNDLVGVVNADGGGGSAIVGVYQRSNSKTTYYPWAYWGSAEPSNIEFSAVAVAQNGATILGVVGVSPTFEEWLFAFGGSSPAEGTSGSYTRIWGNYHGAVSS